MQCALKRFGPGIKNPKPTLVSKEVNIDLQKMLAERERQDKMWDVEKKTPLIRDGRSRTSN